MFRLFQRLEQVSPLILSLGVILHFRIVVHWEAAGAVHVAGQGGSAGICLFQPG